MSGLVGDVELNRHITAPLADGLLDSTWRPDVFLGGYDGADLWTAHTGTLTGLFADTLWGVPPSGRQVEIRYAEFTRIVDGEVAELRVLADLPGLAAQSGWHLFGSTEMADAGSSGIPLADLAPERRESDPAETARTADLLDRFVGARPAERDSLFHDDAIRWACHGLDHMAPDDASATPGIRISDGAFAATCHWPDDDTAPRSMRFMVRRGDAIARSWVLVDLVHLAALRGDDLLARA